MYIVAMYSKDGEFMLVKRNLSKLPLRFDNQAYAERLALESNRDLPAHAKDKFEYIVMKDNPTLYEGEVDFDDDF